MAHATGTVDSLRKSGQTLERALGQHGPVALRHLSEPFQFWMRQLVRVVGCADFGALAAALKGLDCLAAAVERAHAVRPVPAIKQLRAAFEAVEAYIDTVPLAPLGQEPAPDPVLDISLDGVLAHALRLRSSSGSGVVRVPSVVPARGAARSVPVSRSVRPRTTVKAARCAA